ncbi:hypothetical protein [Haloechinothrix alba]|nr:hypothetical protein [Haloechinothrix alba]
MTDHPDIVATGARYDRMAETPAAQLTDGLTMLAGLFVALLGLAAMMPMYRAKRAARS